MPFLPPQSASSLSLSLSFSFQAEALHSRPHQKTIIMIRSKSKRLVGSSTSYHTRQDAEDQTDRRRFSVSLSINPCVPRSFLACVTEVSHPSIHPAIHPTVIEPRHHSRSNGQPHRMPSPSPMPYIQTCFCPLTLPVRGEDAPVHPPARLPRPRFKTIKN
ncbi:hypothetical protein IWX49DRAFT_564919 [Phyllosticta citricarpa]